MASSQLRKHPYILVLGTAEPRKNLVRILRAFDQIAGEFPDLILAMAGQPGWKSAEVSAVLESIPHRARVLTLGYVPDETLPGLLRGAQALCYPSLYEGFGLPVIEGLACATVVVTSAGSVMQEIAADTAIYVDPLSIESIAAGMRTALELSPEARSAITAHGRDHAHNFRWSRTAELTVSAYEQALVRWRQRN